MCSRAALVRSDTTSYCPYKGEASYYHVTPACTATPIWTYEQPYPAVADDRRARSRSTRTRRQITLS